MRYYSHLVPAVAAAAILTLAGAPSAHAQLVSINGFSNFVDNGVATNTTSVLTITDGGGSEANTAFYNTRVNYATSFVVNFTYTASGSAAADGAAFILENATGGDTAVGNAGSGLGYGGMSPSAAVEFNIYSGHTLGTAFATGGTTGNYNTTGSVNLGSGDNINVTLKYSSSLLTETLFDTTTSASYSTSYVTNLATSVGGSGLAYIGFSGGTGGSTSIQKISNFSFSNAPEPSSVGFIAIAIGAVAGLRFRRRSNTNTTRK